MKPPYTHLTLDERRELFRLRSAKILMRVIAQRLKRHPSTLYPKIKRNWFHDEEPLHRGSFHVAAHTMAHGRRTGLSKLARHPTLATYVVDRLQAAWSPEQIAGRLQIEPKSAGSVTHETIYAFVYSPHGKALGVFRHLPMARQRRRARYQRKPRGFTIPLENTIEQRPPEISARTSFGHWEGDLIAFRHDYGKSNLTSLVERRSRYTILTRNPDRNATGVVAGVIGKLKALPASARQSVTFDRGTEFPRYPLLKQKLGIDSSFCKPQAPWQKGSVENTNGRVRPVRSSCSSLCPTPMPA